MGLPGPPGLQGGCGGPRGSADGAHEGETLHTPGPRLARPLKRPGCPWVCRPQATVKGVRCVHRRSEFPQQDALLGEGAMGGGDPGLAESEERARMGWPGSGAEAGPALSPARGPRGWPGILPHPAPDAHTRPGDPARPLPEGGLPSTRAGS